MLRHTCLLRSAVYGERADRFRAGGTQLKGAQSDLDLSKYIVRTYKPRSGSIVNLTVTRDMIWDMRQDVRKMQAVAGPRTYSAMLQVVARTRNPELCEALWAEMVRENIEPSEHCYMSLASAYASVGKVEKVAELLEHSKSQLHARYGIMMRALAKAKRTDDLRLYLHESLDAGFKLTRRHMVVLISGQTDPVEAWRLLSSMRTHYEILPTSLVCNAALGVCIPTGDIATATLIVEFMQDRGIRKNESTFSSLCGVYSQVKRLDLIDQTIATMGEMNVPVNVHIYATYIRCLGYLIRDALSEDRDTDVYQRQAEATFQQAIASGHDHAPYVFTNMLELYTFLDDDEGIEKVTNVMKANGTRISSAYTAILEAYRVRRGCVPASDTVPVVQDKLLGVRSTPFFEYSTYKARVVEATAKHRKRMAAKVTSPIFGSSEEEHAVRAGLKYGDMRAHKQMSMDSVGELWVDKAPEKHYTAREWQTRQLASQHRRAYAEPLERNLDWVARWDAI
eukprot:Rhum_TRINITY_DN10126_c0_g1::Rhum_TRINITY_DN10126_c0_g1_i1::g.36950::m.36950